MSRPVLAAALLLLTATGCHREPGSEPSGASGESASAAPAPGATAPSAGEPSAELGEAAASAPETAAALGVKPGQAQPQEAAPQPNPDLAQELMAGDFVVMPSGTRVLEIAPGTGQKLEKGMTASFTYVTYLDNGAEIDKSAKVGAPITLPNIGAEDIMPFLNEGLIGLAPGGKRRLIVPPSQAYGDQGRPPIVPPRATLIFEVELVGVQAGLPPIARPDVAKLKLKANPSGLKWTDIAVGQGGEVRAGDDVLVNYAGYLEDGTEFDSSARAGRALPIANVGQAGVIAGWNEGLQGMRAGGRRVLVIPPGLAYGEKGFPGAIPPNATLVFVIDALQVRGR